MAALVPSGVVTKTLAAPAEPAGVVQVMEVSETTTTLVQADPPTVTPVAPVNFVPVMVTAVPPDVGPRLMEDEPEIQIEDIVGATVTRPVTKKRFTFVPLTRPVW